MDNKLAIDDLNIKKALIGKFVLGYEIKIFKYDENDIKNAIDNAKNELLKSMFHQTEIEKHVNDGANTFNYQFSVDSYPLHDKIIIKCLLSIYR